MNASEPSPKAQLDAFLSRFSPESVALANRCLAKLQRILPGTVHIVYNYNHCVVVSFGLSERGYEGLGALSVYPDSVRLYFQGGKSIPDPKGLLQGTAGVRYVVLESESDMDHPDIQALFEAAIKHSGLEFPRSGAVRMIMSPQSKKSKPKPKPKPKPKAKAKAKPKAKPKAKAKAKKAKRKR